MDVEGDDMDAGRFFETGVHSETFLEHRYVHAVEN